MGDGWHPTDPQPHLYPGGSYQRVLPENPKIDLATRRSSLMAAYVGEDYDVNAGAIDAEHAKRLTEKWRVAQRQSEVANRINMFINSPEKSTGKSA